MENGNPFLAIRKSVFGLTQREFAQAVGRVQSSISRWESETTTPTYDDLHAIRDAAAEMGLLWNDNWFFRSR